MLLGKVQERFINGKLKRVSCKSINLIGVLQKNIRYPAGTKKGALITNLYKMFLEIYNE